MKTFILTIFLSLFATVAFAECDLHGGRLGDCAATIGSLPPGHPVPPNQYNSAATFVLKDAGCIHPRAVFGFHSSFRCAYGDTCAADPNAPKVLDPQGNAFQMGQFAQYPRLQAELMRRGAFNGLGLTMFNGVQISRLTGLPLCRG